MGGSLRPGRPAIGTGSPVTGSEWAVVAGGAISRPIGIAGAERDDARRAPRVGAHAAEPGPNRCPTAPALTRDDRIHPLLPDQRIEPRHPRAEEHVRLLLERRPRRIAVGEARLDTSGHRRVGPR